MNKFKVLFNNPAYSMPSSIFLSSFLFLQVIDFSFPVELEAHHALVVILFGVVVNWIKQIPLDLFGKQNGENEMENGH